jgi:hypothetical protein
MAKCKAVLKDSYSGALLLRCDVDKEIQHDLHLDKVQGVEWRVPFLGVGVTRITPNPYKEQETAKVYIGTHDPRVKVTIDA